MHISSLFTHRFTQAAALTHDTQALAYIVNQDRI